MLISRYLDKRLKIEILGNMAKIWSEKFNGSVDKTIYEIISDIWQKTKENQPIV
jgi:hypothetical protein